MTNPQRRRRHVLLPLLAVLVGPLTALSPAAADEPRPEDRRADRGATSDVTIAPAEPLLARSLRGPKAIRELGDRLPAVAAGNDLRPAELRTLLREDPTLWVDPQGDLFYVDPAPTPAALAALATLATLAAADAAAPAAAPIAPLEQTFALHSNPGADLTILLDFDGAVVSGTSWNTREGLAPGTHPAWDPAGNGAGFSDAERLLVQQVWAMVAEDYAPFDVDVTTEDLGPERITRSSPTDTVYGTRVLVTPSAAARARLCPGGCGGVAYVDVFDRVGSEAQPAWVFPQGTGDSAKGVAEAASHEAGHNLGLTHDATTSDDYYDGHGDWAPIMGVGYDRPLVQWSAGSYLGADNRQDDVAILTGHLGAQADDATDTVAVPSPLPTDGAGLVGTRSDVDAFLLGSCAPGSTVEVLPAPTGPNLDARIALHDAAGAQRAVAQPPSGSGDGTTASGLGATVTVPAAGDGWVLTVEGVGQGTWATGGYDDYGSLGAYTVTAPGCVDTPMSGAPGEPAGVAASTGDTDRLTLTWSPPGSAGDGPVTGYLVTRSGSAGAVTLPADARQHTFTGLAAGTTYRLTVRAVNATGAGRPVTVEARTATPTPAAPSAPRDLTGSYEHETGKLLAWWTEPISSGTAPITAYPVYLDGRLVGELDGTARGVELSRSGGPYPSGAYTVGVAARNAVGVSPVATVTIRVGGSERPANDDVANAQLLTGAAGSVEGDNTWATREASDPAPPTEFEAGGASVWYSWTPLTDGQVQVATSGGPPNRDTTLAAYTGRAAALVVVAGNDDALEAHAAISFFARAGTRYLLAVDGFAFAGGTGPFVLTWDQQALPPPPGPPTGVSARAGDSSAMVTWSPADGRGAAIMGYTVTATPGGATTSVPGNLTSARLTGLTNGTSYSISVSASSLAGTSEAAQAPAAVVPAGAPGRPRKPTLTVSGRKLTIAWAAAPTNGARVTRYEVRVAGAQTRRVPGGRTRLVLRNLKPRAYRVQVVAVNAVGASQASPVATARVRKR